ncbi:DUF2194 domain-containing protein [Metabacillus sp. 84]|uniref:DUF2194 domain-containing protein n=1 Tax=Metabacillus sp. 84 TaxID=3404705 RepID=UPI003CFBAD00
MNRNVPGFVQFTSILAVLLLAGVLYMNTDRFYASLPAAESDAASEKLTFMNSEWDGKANDLNRIKIYLAEPEKGNLLSERTHANILAALQYAKIPLEVISPRQMESLKPNPYTMIILTGEDSSRWNLEVIKKFVREGGRLFAANRFSDPAWHNLLGIEQAHGYNDTVKGAVFSESFFKGYPDLGPESEFFSNSMLKAELSPDSMTYITAESLPLLWTHDEGTGRVAVWNGTSLQEKSARGLLVHSISLAFPAFLSGQMGGKVMFIDDFPAPIAETSSEQFQKTYGMSYEQFYRNRWWPDMKEISKLYQIPYTGALIGTYQDKPDLSSQEMLSMSERDLLGYGRQLIQGNGELALHGYNHESLLTKSDPVSAEFGYRPWRSEEEMVNSLLEVKALKEELFAAQQLKTYVPPSNLLNRSGISALKKAVPELEVIASLYIGDPSNGSLIQEFDYDSVYKELYHFPRINSGYHFSKEDQFQLADSIANMGVFSHFIHPDDVLDEARSKQGDWEAMKNSYTSMQKFLAEEFSHVKGYKQIDAKRRMDAYQKGKWSFSYNPEGIEIHGYNVPSPSYFYLRLEPGKRLKTGEHPFGHVKKQQDHLYLITMTQPDAAISYIEENA